MTQLNQLQHPRLLISFRLATLTLVAVTAGVAGVAGAEERIYEIQKNAPRATVGVAATASVTVQGRNGWHVNQEAPITVSLKADPGIDLAKSKQGRADLAQSSPQSARFDIPFSASMAGKKTITAETRFVMCQEQACKPVKETVALEFEVASTAAPTPAAGAQKKTKVKPTAH